MIKYKNIINYIKAQRLSWFGYVQRLPDTRTVKKIFNWKPLTRWSQGRPKYRWEDNIKQAICQMKIKNWTACVQDRGKWKEVDEKVKTFNLRKFSAWKKKKKNEWKNSQFIYPFMREIKIFFFFCPTVPDFGKSTGFFVRRRPSCTHVLLIRTV